MSICFSRVLIVAALGVGAMSLSAQPYGLGPYEPAHFYPGSSAILGVTIEGEEIRPNPLFVAWVSDVVAYQPGSGLDFSLYPPFSYPQTNVLGPSATTSNNDVYHVLPLGRGGSVTVTFPVPIRDGPGFDFAVFENAGNPFFIELAWVEVSSDGTHFFRFPAYSLTPQSVGPFDQAGMDPTEVHGFASKYGNGFGTPFDLAQLPDDPRFDREQVRFIRITDIIGNGSVYDSEGRAIYDPFKTSGTAGFDLDAIGVIHAALHLEASYDAGEGRVTLTWPGSSRALWSEKNGVHWILHEEAISYQVQHRQDGDWFTVAEMPGGSGMMSWSAETNGAGRGLYRVLEVPPDEAP